MATRSQAVFGPSQVVTHVFGVVRSRWNQDGAKIESRWGQGVVKKIRGQDGVKMESSCVKMGSRWSLPGDKMWST